MVYLGSAGQGFLRVQFPLNKTALSPPKVFLLTIQRQFLWCSSLCVGGFRHGVSFVIVCFSAPFFFCALERLCHVTVTFLGIFTYIFDIPYTLSGVILESDLGEKVWLTSPYLELREKWKCIECKGKSKIWTKTSPWFWLSWGLMTCHPF